MTPTLLGRWQTRTFLMIFCGVPVTLFFALLWRNPLAPFLLLLYVLLLGLLLDPLWHLIQRKRWENDWPPVLHVLSGIIEGAAIWLLIATIGLPFIPRDLSIIRFLMHYGATFFAIFCVLWGPMKILFPWWRFRGGRLRARSI